MGNTYNYKFISCDLSSLLHSSMHILFLTMKIPTLQGQGPNLCFGNWGNLWMFHAFLVIKYFRGLAKVTLSNVGKTTERKIQKRKKANSKTVEISFLVFFCM